MLKFILANFQYSLKSSLKRATKTAVNVINADIIEIYDISGNLVYTQNVTSDKLTINISTLLKGTYFGYLIRNNNKINSFRLVK